MSVWKPMCVFCSRQAQAPKASMQGDAADTAVMTHLVWEPLRADSRGLLQMAAGRLRGLEALQRPPQGPLHPGSLHSKNQGMSMLAAP